jgi:beta-glucosidase
MAVNYIKGVQSQGVSATVKHFLANNSEFDRHNTDSIIDERTLREIYMPAFEAAVKEAHVGAIMDSYNLANGLHLSQNKYFLTDVAKKEWGFAGLIMSDWSATYDGIEASNAGQDLEMPSGLYMNRQTLVPAIEQGKVSVETINDKVRRILATAVRFGWLDRDQTGLSIPRYNLEGRKVALAAAQPLLLKKNEGNCFRSAHRHQRSGGWSKRLSRSACRRQRGHRTICSHQLAGGLEQLFWSKCKNLL